MTRQELLKTAIEAAIAGGIEIARVYHKEETQVILKGDKSPLTQADKASNDAIMKHLTATKIPVMSEEGRDIPFEERKHWQQLWVVDPLDGTKEFIKRNGEFTVNIALVEDGKPTMGVIFLPESGEMYFADQGQGAFKALMNRAIDLDSSRFEHHAIFNLPTKENRPFTVVASRSHMSTETEDYINLLRKKHGEVAFISRGSSMKICMVAEGKADQYPRFAPTMEWDTAAGHAIVKEAGFEMFLTDFSRPLRYNKPDLLNPWFVVK